ncbi:MAG: response regulator [Fuerstiella sp.]|nr:response regulator [Fuerstiella sp.]
MIKQCEQNSGICESSGLTGSMTSAAQERKDRVAWRCWCLFLVVLCAAPLAMMGLGADFANDCVRPSQPVSSEESVETAHIELSGSYTHTLLEWSAVSAAAFVAMLCFAQYRLAKDPSLLVIGVAMVCAAAMDGVQTLAADRLFSATAEKHELIPFTWALCRLFNGCILLAGIAIFGVFPGSRRNHRAVKVVGICIGLLGIAFAALYACAVSDSLPQTMFPDRLIKRPYDLLPILPFVACGLLVFPSRMRRYQSMFAWSLLLSLIPQIATQLYVAFGSGHLFDSCFNVAHALKAVSYAVPCVGLLAEYVASFQASNRNTAELKRARAAADLQAKLLEVQRDTLVIQAAELEETSIELRLKSQDITRKNEDLRLANREIEQSSAYKSEFLANMSHEIRTPMTAILGFADVLRGTVTEGPDIESVDAIQRNGQYLLGIINDILDLSKIEAGRIELEHLSCSPCRIVSDVVSLIGVRAAAKNISLTVKFDGPIPAQIRSDPTRIRQILINLVGNAIKFTEVGGVCLKLELVQSNSEYPKLKFSVIDTGIGMDEDQMARLFQPFMQADSSTSRKFGGSGLGLAISQRLAELLGGHITITSKPGAGSTFAFFVNMDSMDVGELVTVPIINSADSERDDESKNTPKLNCRILLAEDGPDNQRFISHVLKKAGARVEIAENGQQAIDKILGPQAAEFDSDLPQSARYDVVLMDMQMPVLDGYAASRRLRELGYSGPIIALTAHAMRGDRQKCLDAGCDDYSTKPLNAPVLIRMIDRFARAYSVQPAMSAAHE